jgi:hypothetical protein
MGDVMMFPARQWHDTESRWYNGSQFCQLDDQVDGAASTNKGHQGRFKAALSQTDVLTARNNLGDGLQHGLAKATKSSRSSCIFCPASSAAVSWPCFCGAECLTTS